VVDDDKQILNALRLVLSDQYTMQLAETAKQALEQVDESTSAVLLDIKMPDSDGFQTFMEIKAKNPHVPIIFHSAYQDIKDPYDVMNYYRPFGYIQKGNNTAVLLDTLASAVDYSRQVRANLRMADELRAHNELLEARVASRTRDLERALTDVRRMASIDDLTGLSNRRVFLERLIEELGRARRYGRQLSLAILDIDYFKQVNDTFGHLEGDRVLKEFARLLLEDHRLCDLSARIGGEEFGVILPETDEQGARVYGERIRASVATHRFLVKTHDDQEVVHKLTISVGLCHAPMTVKNLSVDAIMSIADRALYKAKDSGRDCCVVTSAD
jgi:diguanylate cyclase (GGDEF)-like protein